MEIMLFGGNILAGFHAVLIVYFLVGWLIPFAPLWKRAGFNIILASSFLFFRILGWCPLTLWEAKLRAFADPGKEYGASFLSRNTDLLGIDVSVASLDYLSLISTLLILCCALILFNKGRMHSVSTRSYLHNGQNKSISCRFLGARDWRIFIYFF